MAKLYFRYGAMNSGKSTLLLQTAHNYEENGMKVLIVKPKIDTKGDSRIVSRIGATREADLLLEKDENLFEIVKEKYNDVNCVLVDEAQFLSTEQADNCMDIVVNLDIPVICYGLRTDFKTEAFPGSKRLLAIAHTLEEMKTICPCGAKAIFVGRFVNGEFTISGDQVAIDGENEVTYKSMCAKCYRKEKMKLIRK
jgi:thymidine kinase